MTPSGESGELWSLPEKRIMVSSTPYGERRSVVVGLRFSQPGAHRLKFAGEAGYGMDKTAFQSVGTPPPT